MTTENNAAAGGLTREQSAAIDAVCAKLTPPQAVDLGDHIRALRSIQWDRAPKAAEQAPVDAARGDEQAAFRNAVEEMVVLLENGEWAEHVAETIAGEDKLAARLETAITELHNDIGDDRRAVADAARGEPTLWVRVADQLPPKNETVIVAREFDGPGDWRKKAGGLLDDGTWQVFGASWTPTHWTPMPASPGSAPAQQTREAFIRKIAAQKPEKPDHWNSCSQCQHNAEEAQDLIDASPAQQAVTLPDDARECLLDVVSHHDNIVAGFAAQRNAATDANDNGTAAYWTREMGIAHRMKEQAERALTAWQSHSEGGAR